MCRAAGAIALTRTSSTSDGRRLLITAPGSGVRKTLQIRSRRARAELVSAPSLKREPCLAQRSGAGFACICPLRSWQPLDEGGIGYPKSPDRRGANDARKQIPVSLYAQEVHRAAPLLPPLPYQGRARSGFRDRVPSSRSPDGCARADGRQAGAHSIAEGWLMCRRPLPIEIQPEVRRSAAL